MSQKPLGASQNYRPRHTPEPICTPGHGGIRTFRPTLTPHARLDDAPTLSLGDYPARLGFVLKFSLKTREYAEDVFSLDFFLECIAVALDAVMGPALSGQLMWLSSDR